ncbi:MAG: hypothetical protein E7403_08030 [Ruminococcaceae bacterium]|nr:hypothetical protein [Oscillospiraceae bacterium]
MTAEHKTAVFRILMLINNKKLTPKAMHLFETENISLHKQFVAHGTASSDMMDILGLGGPEKDVMAVVLPKPQADSLLKKLFVELELSQKNTGITYTIPLTGISSMFMKFCEQMNTDNKKTEPQKEMEMMSEHKYSLIAATVNQGYSEEVMNASRAVGARGGTFFHNNWIMNEESTASFGAEFNEEKETVLIITEKEKKLDIMKAICDACGMHTPAKGFVISMPIDNIMGLG